MAFAKKWKTYFEKSGGFAGMWGYLTIFYHYSQVTSLSALLTDRQIIYLHIFLVLPLAWLYFRWEEAFTDGVGDGISRLLSTKIEDILDPSKGSSRLTPPAGNIILIAIVVLASLVLTYFLLNVVFRWRLYGKISPPGRGKGTPFHFNFW